MELMNAKGTKDFLPEEKILRDEITQKIKDIFERYGYNPLETPILERYDVVTAKFGAGENSDAMNEIFKLQDQGGRELGLRFELTFPLARVIGMNPGLKMPFKRYQFGEVFRDGPIKLGRMRQFWQCDVDIIGVKSVAADAELLALARDVFQALNLDVTLEVNTRKILSAILSSVNITTEKQQAVLIALDKIKKLTKEELTKELKNLNLNKEQVQFLLEIMALQGTNEEKLKRLQIILKGDESLLELQEFFKYLKEFDIEVIFSPSLVRGLSYYTGPIYEAYLKNSSITSSVAGGGRWDAMIGSYLESDKIFPATGISFGLEPITEALKMQKSIKKSVVQVYVVPIKTEEEAITCVSALRKEGINADIDLVGRGISKNLEYANTYGIPFVCILGKEELSKKKYKLKNMESGEEELLSFEALTKKLIKKEQ